MTTLPINTRLAAVVVLLDTSTNSLVLTKRTKHLVHHAGEICFPGGQYQCEDGNLQMTAIRELKEELGIERSRLSALTPLSNIKTLTGFSISPWFATIDTVHPYQLQVSEVEQMLLIDVRQAASHENYQKITIEQSGYPITTEQFMYPTHKIWGATAKIMHQLCDMDINALLLKEGW